MKAAANPDIQDYYSDSQNIWLSAKDVSGLLNISKRATIDLYIKGKITAKTVNGNGGKQYRILLSSLPFPAQAKYWDQRLAESSQPITEGGTVSTSNQSDAFHSNPPFGEQGDNALPAPRIRIVLEQEKDMHLYASVPARDRQKVDKYLPALKEFGALTGKELKNAINDYNQRHPSCMVSYPRIMDMRLKYEQYGISGLFSGYGKTKGRSKVKDEWYEVFKREYLNERRPSTYTAWLSALGASGMKKAEFPSPDAFMRRLRWNIPPSAIYRARYGKEAWNKKWANYIDRDYSNVYPGRCYVGDHAQIDVAVKLPNGKHCFPWITAFRDMKSSKFVGWFVHAEAPNSDHIFQAMFRAITDFGCCEDVYIDNGKDYRCRDFSGGRTRYKVEVDEKTTNSLLGILGITCHFALPRRAQSKPIERDFLKMKELLSKNMTGYRGGNVKERPESLTKEIREGRAIDLAEFIPLVDRFITDVLNANPSKGKNLKGMCPNELWEKESREKVVVAPESLRLLCMRTSKDVEIGRNGVHDSQIGLTYWAEWMAGVKNTKVYMRRDPGAYQEAYVFRADNSEYLGNAFIRGSAAAFAKTDLEKANLKELIAANKRAEKIEKSFYDAKDAPSPQESLSNLINGVQALNDDRGYMPAATKQKKIYKLKKTPMDNVMTKKREMEREHTGDLSRLLPPEPLKREVPIFKFETEKILWYAEQRRLQNEKDKE